MPARTNRARTGIDESAYEIRERESAQQVARWEAAFRAATSTRAPSPTAGDDGENALNSE